MLVLKESLILFVCFLPLACGKQTVKQAPINNMPQPVVKKQTVKQAPINNTLQPVVKKQAIKTQQKNTAILPIWVEDHRLVNYISAIGTAEPQEWGEQAQYNVAMQDARHNLSIEFKKHHEALQALKIKAMTPQSEVEIDQSIETLLLENAIVQEEWKHPETGRIYLWMIIPDH